MELETAVRLKLNTVHGVWGGNATMSWSKDSSSMTVAQPVLIWLTSRLSKYAESFGAKGLRVNTPDE